MAKYFLGERAAQAVRRLMRGGSSVGSVPGSVGEPIDVKSFASPYEVQWAQSLANGSGTWIIWLPSSDLVNVNGEDYDPSATLTAAGGDYAAGWYQLSSSQLNRQTGGKLYLNIVKSESAGAEYELTFSATATTDEDSYAVPICIATVNATTKERSVKLLTTSVIVIGGSGSVTPTETMPRHFDITKTSTSSGITYKVVNCWIMCGNQSCSCADYTVNASLGDIYLHISRQTSGGYTITVDQNFVAETATSISVKLWEFDTVPVLDVRPGYIPVFAL